jgi:hypothetical protein
MLDSKLEYSAWGTSCDSFGERADVVSVDTRGRIPIAAREVICTPDEVLLVGKSAASSCGVMATSFSTMTRPLPLSTLLDRRDLRKSVKLNSESLRARVS